MDLVITLSHEIYTSSNFSGYKEDASRSRKSSTVSEIDILSTTLESASKSEIDSKEKSTDRRSSRVKGIQKNKIAISRMSPIDRKLLCLLQKAGKLKPSADFEEARNKWLPFVAISKITPEIAFRHTDDWSFLNVQGIVNSITFLPKVEAQRTVKTKYASKQQSLVTWTVGSYNKSQEIEPNSWQSLFATLAKNPIESMRGCLESLKNPKANEGSWIDTSEIPLQGITIDVQNLPWHQKFLHHNHLVNSKR